MNDAMMMAAYNMLSVPKRDIDFLKNCDTPKTITLLVPAEYNHTGFHKITHYHHALFNAYIDKLIKISMYSTLDIATQFPKVQIKTTIISFLNRYGIDEEDMNYEACKKAYYRYREKVKNKTGVLSPRYV